MLTQAPRATNELAFQVEPEPPRIKPELSGIWVRALPMRQRRKSSPGQRPGLPESIPDRRALKGRFKKAGSGRPFRAV